MLKDLFNRFVNPSKKVKQSHCSATAQPKCASPAPEKEVELWKDSVYKQSCSIFKEYFKALSMVHQKDEFYEIISSFNFKYCINAKIYWSQECQNGFDTLPITYVENTIAKARTLANAYLITLDCKHRSEFIKYYNLYANILAPENILNENDLNPSQVKTAIESFNTFFKEPTSTIITR